jgi:hypothetical protein
MRGAIPGKCVFASVGPVVQRLCSSSDVFALEGRRSYHVPFSRRFVKSYVKVDASAGSLGTCVYGYMTVRSRGSRSGMTYILTATPLNTLRDAEEGVAWLIVRRIDWTVASSYRGFLCS